MATASKKLHRPALERPAAPEPEPESKSKAFLRFYFSEALRKKTLAILSAIEQSADPTDHRDALADIVVELTNAGMDYYFIKQLKQAKAGFIVQQTAQLGMAGSLQVMGSVIRNIIGCMDQRQVLSVCKSIRQLMR